MKKINPINEISKAYAFALRDLNIKMTESLKSNFTSIFENVINRYSEPHRMFHTIEHIYNVIKNLKTCKPEVIIAAIYHDIIYVPGSSQNEYCSSQLAAKHLAMIGLKFNSIMTVSKHILATEQHIPVDLIGNEELMDADMSILAAKKPAFNKYCYDIRMEYPHLSDSEFKAQRSRWALEQLGRLKIFHSKKNYKLEAIARKNLRTLTSI